MAAATRTTGVGASAWCHRLVSLDPLHEQIARIAFGLPEAGQVALAGGGAMLAHDLVDRPTQDVDLFTPDPAEVTQLTDALAVALRAEGAQVRVDRRGPGFTRLGVTVADGRSVVVEIAPTTHASAERCSCRSDGCFIPTRWPPTRLWRCLAVPPRETWWMWRRCLSGARSNGCAS